MYMTDPTRIVLRGLGVDGQPPLLRFGELPRLDRRDSFGQPLRATPFGATVPLATRVPRRGQMYLAAVFEVCDETRLVRLDQTDNSAHTPPLLLPVRLTPVTIIVRVFGRIVLEIHATGDQIETTAEPGDPEPERTLGFHGGSMVYAERAGPHEDAI